MDKKNFVEHYLSDLLIAIDADISKVEYLTEDTEEYVFISYTNGCKVLVCVSADSLLAIVKDVIKRME